MRGYVPIGVGAMDGAVATVAVALRIMNHKDSKELKRKLSVLSVPLWLNKFS